MHWNMGSCTYTIQSGHAEYIPNYVLHGRAAVSYSCDQADIFFNVLTNAYVILNFCRTKG